MSDPAPQVTIAGGGPAGITLGYLLARAGIETLVLESQDDFDRDFRGDTLHAGVLEIFDSIGLAGDILELPHYKIRTLLAGDTPLVNFNILRTEFPRVTMMAQSVFLDFLSARAKPIPAFTSRWEQAPGSCFAIRNQIGSTGSNITAKEKTSR